MGVTAQVIRGWLIREDPVARSRSWKDMTGSMIAIVTITIRRPVIPSTSSVIEVLDFVSSRDTSFLRETFSHGTDNNLRPQTTPANVACFPMGSASRAKAEGSASPIGWPHLRLSM
jgi:hypothetical protein